PPPPRCRIHLSQIETVIQKERMPALQLSRSHGMTIDVAMDDLVDLLGMLKGMPALATQVDRIDRLLESVRDRTLYDVRVEMPESNLTSSIAYDTSLGAYPLDPNQSREGDDVSSSIPNSSRLGSILSRQETMIPEFAAQTHGQKSSTVEELHSRYQYQCLWRDVGVTSV
ncbi:hypothetical protein KIPB_013604, partial [Kipferlia bialata]